MSRFVFITDTHFKNQSNVRSDDFKLSLRDKLQYVVDYCNTNNATLLHGGDMFDKPTVPDQVKSIYAPLLLSLKEKALCISGNHDLLYGNQEFSFKTSYNLWVTHNIIKSVDNITIELDDCFVTNEVPLIQRGKPQIVIYHGFLNTNDTNTFNYDNIPSDLTDEVLILLGHDHCEYEPLQLMNNVTIHRPGSFHRATRAQESMRIPKFLDIKVVDGKFEVSYNEIAVAKPYEEVFITKIQELSKTVKDNSYEQVIKQLQKASEENITLEQALKQVGEDDVVEYLKTSLAEIKNNSQFKNKNL